MKIAETLVMLSAGDMDRAVAFWNNGVGLDLRFVSPHWAELLCGETVIALHRGLASSKSAQLGLRVDDVDTACREIVAAGGSVIDGPEDDADAGIRLADVADTEGNAFMVSAPLS